MLLMELFTQPVEFTVIEDDLNTYEAEFKIDDQTYVVTALKRVAWPNETPLPKHTDSFWEVGFAQADAKSEDELTQLTGKGHAATIFATIISFVKSAVKQKEIRALKIAAKTYQPSRVRLYQRMAKTLADQHGWSATDSGVQGDEHVWYIYEQ